VGKTSLTLLKTKVPATVTSWNFKLLLAFAVNIKILDIGVEEFLSVVVARKKRFIIHLVAVLENVKSRTNKIGYKILRKWMAGIKSNLTFLIHLISNHLLYYLSHLVLWLLSNSLSSMEHFLMASSSRVMMQSHDSSQMWGHL
jgi:hypothetical protein